jgi:hypothetical protein
MKDKNDVLITDPIVKANYLNSNYANNLMVYITLCLDSTSKLEHWYVKHKNIY